MEQEYRRLSLGELERVVAQEPVDIVRRMEARAEIDRRRNLQRKPWTRNERIGLAVLIVAVLTLVVAVAAVPSFREFIGRQYSAWLDPQGPTAATSPNSDVRPAPKSSPAPNGAPSVAADVGKGIPGLWAGTNKEGKPLFYRFLQGGKVRISARLNDPRPVVSHNIQWHLSEDQLLMEWSEGGQVTDIYVGTVMEKLILGESDRLDTRFPSSLDKVSN